MTADSAPSAPDPGRSMLVIVAAGAIVLGLAFGVRSVFGALLEPISNELFDGRFEVFALSLAIQNLVWGAAQPAFGAIADRYGDRLAMWIGMVCYLVGNLICVFGTTAFEQHLGAGVLVGMGISGTAFGLVLAVVGRAAPVEKRSQYLGLTSALGSVGQVIMPLVGAELIAGMDWRSMMLIVTALLLPMALCIPFLKAPAFQPPAGAPPGDGPSMKTVIQQAFGYSSYNLLVMGFFVCGFHVAFITAHLPNIVEHFCQGTDMTAEELRAFGLQTLALVGLANIFGTLIAGQLGARFPKPYLLSSIYALRAVVIVLFIMTPMTPTTVLLFGFTMGLLWLSTVPLTTGLVIAMFGPKYMGVLYGFVFLSHQVGSFIGVWLGGWAFDVYGSYDVIWYASIALGVFSAIVHLPVKERAYQPEGAAV